MSGERIVKQQLNTALTTTSSRSSERTDIETLHSTLERRITLPGLSGVPEMLLSKHDTAQAALRAARRTYLLYYRTLGFTPQMMSDALSGFDTGSKRIMSGLFSGDPKDFPEVALRDGVTTLRTAEEIYKGMIEDSIPKPRI